MVVPPVRYVRTPDGFDIAYTVTGEGPVLVSAPLGILNHVQLDWEREESTAPWLRELSSNFRLVHYDSRGQGLSTRGLRGLKSMQDFCTDLEAVAGALGLERFVLYGSSAFTHVAVYYALRHPERVSALILTLAVPSGAVWPRSLSAVADENWEVYLRSRLPSNLSRSEADRHTESLRQSITQADFAALNQAFVESDISSVASQLKPPTLIVHSRRNIWVGEEDVIKLAAAIPNSRLVMDEGGESATEDASRVMEAVRSFLDGLPPEEAPAPGDGHSLSAREVEVLRLVAEGKSNAEISAELVISTNTVVRHLSNIFTKIGVHNRTEAATYAHRRGIV